MNNLIGVMQGRLLPKYQGRYQAHPVGYWQKEFSIAQDIGLNCIEFILDFNEVCCNPLFEKGGIAELQGIIVKTGVQVKTICADYFMEAPLHSVDRKISQKSLEVLHRLLEASETLGVTDIVIPCVDQSSISSSSNEARFVSVLRGVLSELDNKNINLSLETDLSATRFANLINKFSSERVTVNYDVGNSASLGFDPLEELNAYGEKISDIHIKDRVVGGSSVMLGQGDADFDRFFHRLEDLNYLGPFIMQAYRDDEGIAIFKKQLFWVEKYLRGNSTSRFKS